MQRYTMNAFSLLGVALLSVIGPTLACIAEAPDPAELPWHAPADSLLANPTASFPETLAEVGLFPPDGNVERWAERAVRYEPRHPLWTGGSHKLRHLILPEGTSIDTAAPASWGPGAWVFPEGTLLIKTFSFPTPESPDISQPIETRIIRRTATKWEYASYIWSGSDAALNPMKTPVAVVVLSPEGTAFEHHIPSKIQCRKCHESSLDGALAFSELQLTGALELGGASQLDGLFDAGLLSDSPPSMPQTVASEVDDTDAAAIVGYIQGNCTHCHNGSGGPSSSFDLRPPVALQNMIGASTQSSASASGIRIVPGFPSASILFTALSGETEDPEVKAMPPLGNEWRDAAAIEMFRTWIEGL